MKQQLKHFALLVSDYNEAIRYYTQTLNFILVEDTLLSETKRWVRIAPQGDSDFSILLAKAANERQQSRVGDQTGGRVFLFLYTDDVMRDYTNYAAKGVKFHRQPSTEDWGVVAVFEDLYGNLWDLIQPTSL